MAEVVVPVEKKSIFQYFDLPQTRLRSVCGDPHADTLSALQLFSRHI